MVEWQKGEFIKGEGIISLKIGVSETENAKSSEDLHEHFLEPVPKISKVINCSQKGESFWPNYSNAKNRGKR